jgi:hypothetical protein
MEDATPNAKNGPENGDVTHSFRCQAQSVPVTSAPGTMTTIHSRWQPRVQRRSQLLESPSLSVLSDAALRGPLIGTSRALAYAVHSAFWAALLKECK